MLKRIFVFLSWFIIASFAHGQPVNFQYDSLIRRVIERNVVQPDVDTCCPSGVSIIEISRKDSFTVRSLFFSDSSYDLRPDRPYGRNLERWLNKSYTAKIKAPYTVIVPIYYHTNDAEPSDELIKKVEEKIRKWKEKTHVMEPMVLTTLYNQRKPALNSK